MSQCQCCCLPDIWGTLLQSPDFDSLENTWYPCRVPCIDAPLRACESYHHVGKGHTGTPNTPLGHSGLWQPSLLAPNLIASLTARTSGTAGTLTVAEPHPLAAGMLIDFTWSTGSRTNVTIGTVSGDQVPFSGGFGYGLPDSGSLPVAVTISFNRLWTYDYDALAWLSREIWHEGKRLVAYAIIDKLGSGPTILATAIVDPASNSTLRADPLSGYWAGADEVAELYFPYWNVGAATAEFPVSEGGQSIAYTSATANWPDARRLSLGKFATVASSHSGGWTAYRWKASPYGHDSLNYYPYFLPGTAAEPLDLEQVGWNVIRVIHEDSPSGPVFGNRVVGCSGPGAWAQFTHAGDPPGADEMEYHIYLGAMRQAPYVIAAKKVTGGVEVVTGQWLNEDFEEYADDLEPWTRPCHLQAAEVERVLGTIDDGGDSDGYDLGLFRVLHYDRSDGVDVAVVDFDGTRYVFDGQEFFEVDPDIECAHIDTGGALFYGTADRTIRHGPDGWTVEHPFCRLGDTEDYIPTQTAHNFYYHDSGDWLLVGGVLVNPRFFAIDGDFAGRRWMLDVDPADNTSTTTNEAQCVSSILISKDGQRIIPLRQTGPAFEAFAPHDLENRIPWGRGGKGHDARGLVAGVDYDTRAIQGFFDLVQPEY